MPRSRPAPVVAGRAASVQRIPPQPPKLPPFSGLERLPSTAPLSRGLTPRVSPLAGVGRVDCCCCLSLHFPGSTGSGTICFTHTVTLKPNSGPKLIHMAEWRRPSAEGPATRWRKGFFGPSQGQRRGQPWHGQPWHGQPWKGQGEVVLYKNNFFYSLSLSLSLYIYICQPWRGQPWRGPGGGDY